VRAAWLVAARDARVSARLLVLCCLGLVGVAYLLCWGYPEFKARIALMGAAAPRFVREVMLARTGGMSFEGFAGFAFFHPVTLALMAIWPITRAVRAVAGDMERGALGWMLAYPVGRVPFLLARAAVLLAGCAILQGVLLGALRGWATWFHVGVAPASSYLWAALAGGLMYGAIGALTLWASAASQRAAVPATLGAMLMMGSLVLERVGGSWPILESWRWLSLFHYYQAPEILRGTPPATSDLLVLAGLLVAGLVGATWTFARRDLPI